MTLEALALTEQGQALPLDTALSLHADDMALEHQLSITNAIIYASARQFDAFLSTADNHFKIYRKSIISQKNTPHQ